MGQPDYRVYEMNRRLQQWTEVIFCLAYSSFDEVSFLILTQKAFCDIVVIQVKYTFLYTIQRFTVFSFLNYFIVGLYSMHALQDTDNLWWDSFATDFFEDDATFTLTFGLEDGPKRYSMCTLDLYYFV